MLDDSEKTNLFDPTNRFGKLGEESVKFVDGLVVYNSVRNPGKLLPVIYDKDLAVAIGIVKENPKISYGFTPREDHVMVYLIKYVPEILRYKHQIRGTAMQIDYVVYADYGPRGNLADVKGEEYVWSKFVDPAISHIVELQEKEEIDLSGLNDREVGQVLLPMELTQVEIKTGKDLEDYRIDNKNRLMIAVNNVSYDPELEKSPQEWLREISKKIYEIGSENISWEYIENTIPLHIRGMSL